MAPGRVALQSASRNDARVEIEGQGHVAFGVFLRDRRGKILGEDDTVAGAKLARPLGEGAPGAAAEIAMQGHLDAGLAAPPGEAAPGSPWPSLKTSRSPGRKRSGRSADMPVGEIIAADAGHDELSRAASRGSAAGAPRSTRAAVEKSKSSKAHQSRGCSGRA